MPRCDVVLAGRRSCDWYDQQGELGSNYHKVIARLIYPTRCSKCHSGVLIFHFNPFDKMIPLSWAIFVLCM